MKILLVCAFKFHSDHVAYQLQKNGLLYRVITAYPAPFYCNREPLDKSKIIFLTPFFMFYWLLIKTIGRIHYFQLLINWLMSAAFDRLASLFVGRPDISISWAWSSYYIIKKIKRQGKIAIVEKCGSFNKHQEKILKEEYERLGYAYRRHVHKRILEREHKECEIADYILCPSQYVANSLTEYGIKKEKIIIVPYGVNLDLFKKEKKQDDVFRVIFVGNIGVHKGLIYLFKALEKLQLSNFECLLIGKIEPCFITYFNQYRKYFEYIPKIAHKQLRYYYSNASVLVFPSLDEGFSLVQLEAMACGLPVITTFNAGASAVVRDNQEGFLVPIRDSEAIKEKIEFLYNNPHELKRLAENALKRAKEFSWDNYIEKLVNELNILKQRDSWGVKVNN